MSSIKPVGFMWPSDVQLGFIGAERPHRMYRHGELPAGSVGVYALDVPALIRALEFYAEPGSWERNEVDIGIGTQTHISDGEADRGKVAREALAKVKT